MKRFQFSKILVSLSAVVVACNFSSCVDSNYYPSELPEPVKANNNGAKFKQDLMNAIEKSSRVVVLQHSHSSDFKDIVTGTGKAPYYSYGSRVLSSSSKADFLSRVANLSAYNRTPTKQDFEPHHTIKFYSGNRLTSTMRVSFGVNEVKWNGSKFVASQDIMRAIGPVVSNAGFRTVRDWKGVAKIEYNSGRRTSGGSIGTLRERPAVKPRLENRPSLTPPPLTKPVDSIPVPVKPIASKIPVAKKVPGKPGTVFNPFTNNHVDVGGIPPGTKVRDPNDNNSAHVFRVP